ncbi:lyase family protein, partial [Vibrio parahaemolyticus VP-48]
GESPCSRRHCRWHRDQRRSAFCLSVCRQPHSVHSSHLYFKRQFLLQPQQPGCDRRTVWTAQNSSSCDHEDRKRSSLDELWPIGWLG